MLSSHVKKIQGHINVDPGQLEIKKTIEIPSPEDLMEMQDVDEQLASLGVVHQVE